MKITRALVPAALIALAAFGWSRTQGPAMGISDQQKELAPMVGEWEVSMTMHTPMGPMPAEGVEKNRMVCDKWLETDMTSEMMGMSFAGRGLFGWDAQNERYSGVWVDNMGAEMFFMEGVWSEEDSSIVWTYDQTNGMTGQKGTARIVDTLTDANTRAATFYFKPQGGEEEVTMEFTYRRKGAAKPAEASGKK
jgi:hypothetical protein